MCLLKNSHVFASVYWFVYLSLSILTETVVYELLCCISTAVAVIAFHQHSLRIRDFRF